METTENTAQISKTEPTCLLISVGGSAAPIIYSINQQQPSRVIYFCSRESRKEIRSKIEPELTHQILDHEIITTEDEQNLMESVRELVQELPKCLKNLGCTFAQLKADYTGGTKPMAAAVVLALADKGCQYTYVGGVSRDKEGLGVVMDNREIMLHSDNPWDALGRDPLKIFALHFNRCRFTSAAHCARDAAKRCEALKPLFSTLAKLAEGYGLWDSFNYSSASNSLAQCITPLQTLPCMQEGRDISAVFAAQLEHDLKRLKRIKNDMQTLEGGKCKAPSDGSALLQDLLSNAVRRAEREHKYDDAVSRLYSVIEKSAKIRLRTAYAINNSCVVKEDIPSHAHDELYEYEAKDDNGCVKLPLGKSFALLDALEDPLGTSFREKQRELEKVMDVRNNSLLAHGYNPVKESTYNDMLDIALGFCALNKEDIPQYPDLPE
jgi:CRISPR-associated protein (TIGR02710 family)